MILQMKKDARKKIPQTSKNTDPKYIKKNVFALNLKTS